VGTRFIATPQARAVAGYKDALIASGEDGTVVSRSYTGKTCRVLRNEWTNEWDAHPERIKPFPQQAIESMQQGANHLGDGEDTIVDVQREFMPAGQGVGAIHSLIDAGELVRQFVAEAHDAMRGLA
jgi:enoyl-[acyl-carrier protein] reductase II